MNPTVVKGFTVGVLVAAVGTGVYAVNQGWLQALIYLPPARHITLFPNPSHSPAPQTQPAPTPSPSPVPGKSPGELPALEPLAKPAPATPPAPKPTTDPARGAFDIVRVEPSGELVVAGRCAPDCTVALTVGGKAIETVKADPSGSWAMTPPALPPGDHQLGLTVTTPDGRTATSEQSVTVSVPTAPSKEVVVVLNEPNAPSKVLQRPGQPAAAGEAIAARPAAPVRPETAASDRKPASVSIVAVDTEKGRLFIQGTAPAGGSLRVYLNDAPLAEPVAGKDERWSVRVEKGLTPGEYAARVDQLDNPSGKVIARAEARFTYEGEMAETAPQPGQAARTAAPVEPGPATAAEAAPARTPGGGATTASGADPARDAARQPAPAAPQAGTTQADAPPVAAADPGAGSPDAASGASARASGAAQASDAANPVVAGIDTARVERGDSLWRISRKIYGKGMRYTVIFSANDRQIRDPDLIYPGQMLVMPNAAAAGGTAIR